MGASDQPGRHHGARHGRRTRGRAREDTVTSAELVARWREQADAYERDGATAHTAILCRVADEVDAAWRAWREAALTLAEPAAEVRAPRSSPRGSRAGDPGPIGVLHDEIGPCGISRSSVPSSSKTDSAMRIGSNSSSRFRSSRSIRAQRVLPTVPDCGPTPRCSPTHPWRSAKRSPAGWPSQSPMRHSSALA